MMSYYDIITWVFSYQQNTESFVKQNYSETKLQVLHLPKRGLTINLLCLLFETRNWNIHFEYDMLLYDCNINKYINYILKYIFIFICMVVI